MPYEIVKLAQRVLACRVRWTITILWTIYVFLSFIKMVSLWEGDWCFLHLEQNEFFEDVLLESFCRQKGSITEKGDIWKQSEQEGGVISEFGRLWRRSWCIPAASWAADRMERSFLEPLERLYGACCNTENCQGTDSGQASWKSSPARKKWKGKFHWNPFGCVSITE